MLRFPTTSSTLLAPFIDILESKGLDVDSCLRASSLPDKQTCLSYPYPISTPLIYLMFTEIAKINEFQNFGWCAGKVSGLSGLGQISIKASNEKTLTDALNVFVKMSKLGSSHASFFIKEEGEQIIFCHKGGANSLTYGYYQFELYLLTFFKGFIELTTGAKFTYTQVGIRSRVYDNCPLKGVAELQPYFYFVVPKTLLKSPLKTKKMNCKKSENILLSPKFIATEKDEPFYRLKALLAVYCSKEIPNLDIVSIMAESSKRTLQRKLSQHNTSYSNVLQQVKIEQAKSLLKETSLSVATIAENLGYKNSTHFIRAFKQVTGITPRTLRIK